MIWLFLGRVRQNGGKTPHLAVDHAFRVDIEHVRKAAILLSRQGFDNHDYFFVFIHY